MKHVTYAGKTLFTGDDAADALIEYAAALAHARDGDAVRLKTISSDGNETEALFLLDTGAPLMAESTNSTMTEPDNTEVVEYMRRRIRELSNPRPLPPSDEAAHESYEDFDFSEHA